MKLLAKEFQFQKVSTLTVDRWADSFRRLPSLTAIPGAWSTARNEAARGPMRSFTEPGVQEISICAATQTIKSEVALAIIGFLAHVAPAPILFAGPKEDWVENFSRERLARMISETPELRERFDWRQKSGEAKLLYKEFAGGFICLISGGSDVNLASRSARYTLADEVDSFPVLKTGDGIQLLEERTAAFGDRAKHVRMCSPTFAETSRIWKLYQAGDRRQFFLECPHCSTWGPYSFFRRDTGDSIGWVDWTKTDKTHQPETAALYCGTCGSAWTEDERRKALTMAGGVRWYQTRPYRCDKCDGEDAPLQEPLKVKKFEWSDTHCVGYALCGTCGRRAVSNKHASFQASKIISPWLTLATLAERWLVAHQHPDTDATFRTNQLGEPSMLHIVHADLSVQALLDRREDYSDVPDAVLRLTLGVDQQHDGFHCHLLGWGAGEEIWSCDYKIIPGDTLSDVTWGVLSEYMHDTEFPRESGGTLKIQAVCIDAGDRPDKVKQFCALRKNVYATKGSSDKSSATWRDVWPAERSKATRDYRSQVKVIGVSRAKQYLENRLAVETPGPNYFHLDMTWDEGRISQLLSEHKRLELKGDFKHYVWEKKRASAANEALDATVLAIAAHYSLEAQGRTLEKLARKHPRPHSRPRVVRPSKFMEGDSHGDEDNN